MLPRGQGKSSLAAALGLYNLFEGGEGAVVWSDERGVWVSIPAPPTLCCCAYDKFCCCTRVFVEMDLHQPVQALSPPPATGRGKASLMFETVTIETSKGLILRLCGYVSCSRG